MNLSTPPPPAPPPALSRPAPASACQFRSGPTTTALVELYTSEGCSSCPPADKQLSRLKSALEPGAQAVVLALHVDYWDSIGWRDPFGKAEHGQRQRALVALGGQRTVYTPQFFVGGGEVRDWPGDLRDTVRRIHARAAPVEVSLQTSPIQAGRLTLSAEAKNVSAPNDPASLLVVIREGGLSSAITRGENQGATLAHEAVVRHWLPPVKLVGGRAHLSQELVLDPAWKVGQLSVVAWVQNERTGQVWQALEGAMCPLRPEVGGGVQAEKSR